jgi:hypothetical protein
MAPNIPDTNHRNHSSSKNSHQNQQVKQIRTEIRETQPKAKKLAPQTITLTNPISIVLFDNFKKKTKNMYSVLL